LKVRGKKRKIRVDSRIKGNCGAGLKKIRNALSKSQPRREREEGAGAALRGGLQVKDKFTGGES